MKTLAFILPLLATLFSLPVFGQVSNSKTGNFYDSDSRTGIAYNARARVITAATYTVNSRDHTILANAESNAITVSLPTAAGFANNQVVAVQKTDWTLNKVTVDASGTQLIDGRLTFVLDYQNDTVFLTASNGSWHVLGTSGSGRQTLVSAASLTNGTATAKTQSLMDDTPAAEFSALTLVGAQPTITQSTKARKGSNSLKLAFANAASANDGVQWTAFSAVDWTTAESVGFWVYSTKALTAGDVMLKTVDSTVESAFSFGAVSADTWTWVELDISSLATTNGDAVTNYKVYLSTAGAALGAFDLYLDGAWKWDNTEEVALGVDLLDRQKSVENVFTLTTANTGTHDFVSLTEDTDFFVASRSGNDSLVTISDQSGKSALILTNRK